MFFKSMEAKAKAEARSYAKDEAKKRGLPTSIPVCLLIYIPWSCWLTHRINLHSKYSNNLCKLYTLTL